MLSCNPDNPDNPTRYMACKDAMVAARDLPVYNPNNPNNPDDPDNPESLNYPNKKYFELDFPATPDRVRRLLPNELRYHGPVKQ